MVTSQKIRKWRKENASTCLTFSFFSFYPAGGTGLQGQRPHAPSFRVALPFSVKALETSSQTSSELCLLGDSKSCQGDNKVKYHSYSGWP